MNVYVVTWPTRVMFLGGLSLFSTEARAFKFAADLIVRNAGSLDEELAAKIGYLYRRGEHKDVVGLNNKYAGSPVVVTEASLDCNYDEALETV